MISVIETHLLEPYANYVKVRRRVFRPKTHVVDVAVHRYCRVHERRVFEHLNVVAHALLQVRERQEVDGAGIGTQVRLYPRPDALVVCATMCGPVRSDVARHARCWGRK